MESRTVRRFRKRTVALHWLHTIPFLLLAITGGLMFLRLTGLEGGLQAGLIHRVAAAVFVVIPAAYGFSDLAALGSLLKETFHWCRADLKWLAKAPRYYFGKPVGDMPPQGRINADQKLWQLVTVVAGLMLAATGAVQWFFKFNVPVSVYQWAVVLHDSAFVIIVLGFLVHFYLTSFHPAFDESLSSMIDGKVSSSYAKEHYPKWYERLKRGRVEN